ncbi:MAG: NAD+ synthase [Ignavibacteria bacterium]|nr:NAD+ synthase [Ignavibacteria bacterium]
MLLDCKILETKIVEFLREETSKAGIKKGVLGLSGGIDSALSAFLTVKALGKDNLLCVLMPYKTGSRDSITDAVKVIDKLQVRYQTVEITPMVDSCIKVINDSEMSNIRKGNIMARIRMITLYDISHRENALVIGTGNRTEIYLGYTTVYGDSACALNPIGGLYKTQVRALSRCLGVPEEILNKKPTADLWKGQTDEGEMGITYEEADKYLYNKFDLKKSQNELLLMGFTQEFIDRIEYMIKKNRFKSKMPPVAVI